MTTGAATARTARWPRGPPPAAKRATNPPRCPAAGGVPPATSTGTGPAASAPRASGSADGPTRRRHHAPVRDAGRHMPGGRPHAVADDLRCVRTTHAVQRRHRRIRPLAPAPLGDTDMGVPDVSDGDTLWLLLAGRLQVTGLAYRQRRALW